MKGRIRRRSKGSWEITIDLGRDAEGNRLRKYESVRGKRADADRRLRELMTSLDHGLPVSTSKFTVGEHLDAWFRDYVVPNTRPSTAERYEVDIRLHLKPTVGRIGLGDLKAAHVQGLIADLFEKGLAHRSVRNAYRVLNESIRHGIRWGLVYHNPCDAVTLPKGEHRAVQPPDMSDVKRILESAAGTMYYEPLFFLVHTGVRRGECLGLRWTDIDFVSGTASIVRSIGRVRGQGMVFQPVKSEKSRRAIALDSDTLDLLRQHQGRQLLLKASIGDMYKDHGLVFPNDTGEPSDTSNFSRGYRVILRRAGLDNVRIHDMRHFHASELLKSGINLKVVQERLGHADISTTANVYAHVAPTMQREAADAFAEAFSRSPKAAL